MAKDNFFTIQLGLNLPKSEVEAVKKQIYEATRNIQGQVSMGPTVSGKSGRPPQTMAQEVFKTGRHAALAAPIYGAIYGGMATIQQSIQSYIEFDKVLTRIQMVSGKSAESMKSFAEAASEAGKKLSVTAKDYADASLIFFQQGGAAMDHAEKLAAAAIKLSNATGQAMGDSADSITAIMNSFGMLAEEGEKTGDHIADVLLKLDQSTASSGAEISDALTRFAAVAATAGFSYEEAAAQVATISSATRLSAETIGTALKTFYSNLQEVKDAGPEAVEKFTSDLQKIASKYKLDIHPFGPEGELISGKEILDQIAAAYETMTSNTERQDLVATIAGKHQITQVTALLSNWNEYEKNLTSARNAQGAANEAQALYAESIQAHLNQMANAWEHFTHSIMESESFKIIIDFLTKFIQLLETVIGGQSGLLKLTALFVSLGVILNADKITKFWNVMKSGILFQNTEQAKYLALKAKELEYEQRIEAARAAGNMQAVGGLTAAKNRLPQMPSPIMSAVRGAGVAGGLAGGIGIVSDISAGKSFTEALTGNIGSAVGGAAGGAIGAAFGPIGIAIGGMIGSQIGNVVNKSIIDAINQTENAIKEYAAGQAEKYKENKDAIHDIVVEYEYLNIEAKDQEYATRRINELKEQLKKLLPDITNLESLTVNQLKEQVELQEYYLKLQSQDEAKQQLDYAVDKMRELQGTKLPGFFSIFQGVADKLGPAIEKTYGFETDFEKRTKQVEEYKKTIDELSKDGVKLSEDDRKRFIQAKAGLAEYNAYLKAYQSNQQETIKLTLKSSDAFVGLTEDQLNASVDFLQKAGYNQQQITTIFREQGSTYDQLIPQIQEVADAQKASSDAVIEQRAAVDELNASFKKMNEESQLTKLRAEFENLGIPPSVIDDLKDSGLSLVQIMERLTEKMFAHGMIQSLSVIPMDPAKKLEQIRPYAAILGINVPTVDVTQDVIYGGYAGMGGIVAGTAQEAVDRVVSQLGKATNYQDMFPTQYGGGPEPTKMATGGDPYAGAEFLIKQYDRQIELLKKEDQTLDTISQLATKSQQKAAKLTGIIDTANKEKAKALATLGLGANASPEQIAARISEINSQIISGGMTEETAAILRDAISDYTTAVGKANDATDEFKSTLNDLANAFKDLELAPGLDKLIEATKNSADSFKQYQDTMLVGAEKTLAFSDLQSQISEALSETTDQYSRDKLLEYQKEINALEKSGVAVTDARYQYYLKQIGVLKERIRLEKESNAENKLMLVRQAGGGFTYQFQRNITPGAAKVPTAEETEDELTANAQDFFTASTQAVANAAANLNEETKQILGDKAVEVMQKIQDGMSIDEAIADMGLTEDEKNTVANGLSVFQASVEDARTSFGTLKDNLPTNELASFQTQMDNINSLSTDIGTTFSDFKDIFDVNKEGSPANTLKKSLITLSTSIKSFIPQQTTGGGGGGAGSGAGGTDKKKKPKDEYVKPTIAKETYGGDKSKLNTKDSVIDYLKSKDLASDKTTRKNLYDYYVKNKKIADMGDFEGSPEQNTALLKQIKADGFASGGYTGDNQGFAMLHEKELVLNKLDTRNILNAVKIMRSMPNFGSMPNLNMSQGGTNQSVVINASFPNVSSADEIKKAFASMSNNALQFNTRNKVIGAGVK